MVVGLALEKLDKSAEIGLALRLYYKDEPKRCCPLLVFCPFALAVFLLNDKKGTE